MSQMRVGWINVPSKVGARAWARCWMLMRVHATVFGINETFMKSCKRVYAGLARVNGFGQYGLRQGPNPIFYSRRVWKFVEADHVQLHGKGPNSKKWPGFNDERYLTILVLERRLKRRQGARHAFLFTHWAAFGGNDKVPNKWVNDRHSECIDYVHDIIELGLSKGYIVHFSGDTNMGEPIKLHPKMKMLKNKGIDKYGVAFPPEFEFESGDLTEFNAPTDHKHGYSMKLRFFRRQKEQS